MGEPSNKNRQRRLRRTRRNAHRYMKTTHPSPPRYCSKTWYMHSIHHDNDYCCSDFYTEMWEEFFHEHQIPIIDRKFPKTFPRHLFDAMKLDQKKFPQLCSI